MVESKVLVGCPTADAYAYCLDEYAKRVNELSYKNYDVLIVDNSKDDKYMEQIKRHGFNVLKGPCLDDVRERVIYSRNMIRDYFLKNGYDYFLSLEQDVIPPKDVIERLIRHKKEAVSGVYYKHFHITYKYKGKPIKTSKKIMPLICTLLPGMEGTDKAHLCSTKDVEGDRFFQIRGAGLGCLLMHRSILEKIKFRTDIERGTFDDLCLSNDLYHNKIPMYVDTSVKCKHMITKKYDRLFENVTKP